ncbi:MAG: hypothetical protein WA118_11810 [Carboxydocellales bacterium]|jgi:hypothetical protein
MEIRESQVRKWLKDQTKLAFFHLVAHKLVEETHAIILRYDDERVVVQDESGEEIYITWEALVNIEY